ncbi:MAG: hypothetical protein GXP62_09990 [Oligoflexia bacterium]|nr:hypothetical protein [Oligoflexia bacterium]
MTPEPPLAQWGDDVASPPFHIWIRRVGQVCTTCALRFEVKQGKGVLRVSRPGVLIVPPARDHGYEEHLAPPQLRSSLFLHVPGHGRPRSSFPLDRLTDAVIGRMDIDVWHELSLIRGPKGQYRLEYREDNDDCEVLGLGGRTESPMPQQVSAADFARIGQIVELVGAHVQAPDGSVDEIIEADSDTAQSQIGFTLFPEDRPDQLLEPPSAPLAQQSASQDLWDSAALETLVSATPAVDLVDHTPPPVRPSAPESSPSLPSSDEQPHPSSDQDSHSDDLQVFPGGPQKLARHLRRQLARRDLTIMQLRQRVLHLEQHLRDLGGDPEAL